MSKIFKGAFLLTAGQVAGYGCSLLRNIILARLLAKADFGLAAAFAMTVGLIEFGSRMSFGVQTVQSAQGDSERFQNTSHKLQFLVGAVSALLLVALSYPFAHFFDVPEASWAFATLATIPLFRGLEHLDTSRFRRKLNFGPSVACESVPQLLVTLVAWPVVAWLPDYRAILVLLVAKSALTVAMTHVLAQRKYRWDWDRDLIRSFLIFSWPLILNGYVMFLAQGADQMLVGAFLSLDDLATYSVAFSLISLPWFVAAQVSSSLMLPILAPHQNDALEFRRRYRFLVQGSAIASLTLITPLIVAGDAIIALLYGDKYSGTGEIVALLGATCALRFLRLAPAIGALARGDTINQFYSNIARASGLPLALSAALLSQNLLAIAAGGLVGEAIAGLYSFLRLRRSQQIPLIDNLRPVLLILAGLGIAAILMLIAVPQNRYLTLLLVLPLWGSIFGMSYLAFPDTVKWLTRHLFLRGRRPTPLVVEQST